MGKTVTVNGDARSDDADVVVKTADAIVGYRDDEIVFAYRNIRDFSKFAIAGGSYDALVRRGMIRTGTFTITGTYQTITFASPFPGAPVVLFTMQTANSGTWSPKTRYITANDFDAVLSGSSTTPSVVNWVAIYQEP